MEVLGKEGGGSLGPRQVVGGDEQSLSFYPNNGLMLRTGPQQSREDLRSQMLMAESRQWQAAGGEQLGA